MDMELTMNPIPSKMNLGANIFQTIRCRRRSAAESMEANNLTPLEFTNVMYDFEKIPNDTHLQDKVFCTQTKKLCLGFFFVVYEKHFPIKGIIFIFI